MATTKELDERLRALGDEHAELADAVRKLVTHVAVLAVAVREPGSVPQADLDEALAGISALQTVLASAISPSE